MRPLLEATSPSTRLTARLAELYGGDLELPPELLYANFVTSLDGVAALPAPARSGALLSGRNPADRFLMGLLRALSDAVVVGAGTLRAEPGPLWPPAYVSRGLASAFAALGRPDPRTVIVSASGELDPGERALERGALVLTTDAGAARPRGAPPRQPAAGGLQRPLAGRRAAAWLDDPGGDSGRGPSPGADRGRADPDGGVHGRTVARRAFPDPLPAPGRPPLRRRAAELAGGNRAAAGRRRLGAAAQRAGAGVSPLPALHRPPLRRGVDVEAGPAQKADQGQVEAPGGRHGQAAGCAHRSQHRDAGRDRLLHDLVAAPAADQ